MALAAAARQGAPRAHPKEEPARRDGEPRQRRGAQADGRRQGRQAEAGRAGRRAAARQAGRGGARRQTGSAAAKIFGDIRVVRGRKNIRGHLTSGKPPEKARVRKRPCVFRDRGSPRWRAGCRGGAATPERPDRPRSKPYTAGYRLRGLASAECASRFGGRLGRFFAGESEANGGNTRAPSRPPNRDAQSADASPRSRKPAAAARRRGEPRSRKTHGLFPTRAFSGGFPLPRCPRIFLRPRTPRMSPNIFAAALPVCLRAPPLPACLAAARLPARPASASAPRLGGRAPLSGGRGGIPALPPLQVPREP